MYRRSMAVIAAVLIAFLACAGAAGAAAVPVSDEADLRDNLTAGTSVILTADIVLTGGNITLASGTPALDLGGFNLTASQDQRLFDIGGGAEFTLSDSDGGGSLIGNGIVDGDGGCVCIRSEGLFVMNGGTITGFQTAKNGGGVGIADASFIMNGGAITGCSAAGWYGGGGVFTGFSEDEEGYILDYGTFTMNGGTIADCEATYDFGNGGGVYAEGTFTMNGGAITRCNATGSLGKGGGVAIGNYKPFAMTNATIADCSASFGGGVSVFYGDFTLTNCSITGCQANDGAGVSYDGNSFIVTDGIIRDNTAGSGAGIYSLSSVHAAGTTELADLELLKSSVEYYTLIIEDGFTGSVENLRLSNAETREENPSEWAGHVVVENGAAFSDAITLHDTPAYDGCTLVPQGDDLIAVYQISVTAEDNRAEFGAANCTGLSEDAPWTIQQVRLNEVTSVENTAVTFNASDTTLSIPQIAGYEIEQITVFELDAQVQSGKDTAAFNVSIIFDWPGSAEEEMDRICFLHYDTEEAQWDTAFLPCTYVRDEATVTYTVETASFSPFGIGLYSETQTPVHKKPSSGQTGSTIILTETPTMTPTAAPTQEPAEEPTAKPATTPQSPAPFAGLVLGLGAAAVLLRLRR